MLLIAGIGLIHLISLVILFANFRMIAKERSAQKSDDALPRLSVVIPARNEARNLERLLPTVLNQAYPGLEIILYDDASEDDTDRVIAAHADPRLKVIHGQGPTSGWIGKPYALFQATRVATGELYLFLDADAALTDRDVLHRLAVRYTSLVRPAYLTGLTGLEGGGMMLVSLVPNALLTVLPWPLIRRWKLHWLSGLNGQCWMIDRERYHQYEPHARYKAEVLEDVQIGRYLTRSGVTPHMVDVRREVVVRMYDQFDDAWRGFRKNAYLLMGGHPASFLAFFVLFGATYVLGPGLHPALLVSLFLLKGFTDRFSGMPWHVTLLAPASYFLALVLQLDSALHHWFGRVRWKGRAV